MVSCQNWGPYPACLRMADRALLARYPRIVAPINSFPPRQNGCHFAYEIFRRIFMNEKFCTLIKVSLEFVPERPIKVHWGRVTHICVGNLTIIGLDNGLSPGRRQAIFWTNAGILLIGPWGTNVNEILIGIQAFSFRKMHLKMLSAKWRPFCLGFNVLTMDQHWFR